MRQSYAERHATLLDEAQSRLAGLLEIRGVEAGLQTVGRLVCGLDAETAARAAARRNIEVTQVGRYAIDAQVQHSLHLGFASLDPRRIGRGVQELAIALEEELRHRTGAAQGGRKP